MLNADFEIMPEQGGSLFVGSRQSASGLNQQIWAKITGSSVAGGVTYYSWQQYTPYNSTLVIVDGGMYGTVSPSIQNPIIEVNGLALVVGNFVKVRQAYFDAVYDWVFFAESNPLSGGAATGHTYLGRQVFYPSGTYTYTQTAGTTLVVCQLLGGGGGSGGVKGQASSVGASGGGGGGGYTEFVINPSTINGASINVGAGGTAGNSSPTAGGNGGNSSISGQAPQGAGGSGSLGVASSATPGQNAGAAGGVASGGTINVRGEDGGFGFSFISGAFLDAVGGKGGNGVGPYGGGGQGGGNGAGGAVGTQYGSGGSGAASITALSFNGAAGGDGIIVIQEYT